VTVYAALETLLNGATDAADRIYPNAAPSKPGRPYIICLRAAANSENVLAGNANLINTRMQIDCYADTYAAVQTLAAQIDALMRGWTLQNVSYPAQDQFEPDVRLHRVILEYSIWHT
jgi:outer membrane murein-binding lipoprotein Lpp